MRKSYFHGLIALVAGLSVAAACHALMPDQAQPSGAPATPDLSFQNVDAAWSATPVERGYRFEVRQGDQLPGDRGAESKERSEAYDRMKLVFGQTYEIGFSLEIAPGAANSAKWMTLAQIQSTFDPGEQGHSPPFGLYMEGEKMVIAARSSPVEITPLDGFLYLPLYKDREDIRRGHPYRMKIRVRFDRGGTGAVRVWRDDRLIAAHDGPFGFNDRQGPYFKIGVYRASAPESYAMTVRDLALRPIASIDE